MQKVTTKAYGKINLGLNVGDVRPDGFHEVAMILQSVALYDEVSVEKVSAMAVGEPKVELTMDIDPAIVMSLGGEILPVDERNLAVKAAKFMQEKYLLPSVHVHVIKHIPVAAGMAGGSTDAASVILCMNALFELGLHEEEMAELSGALGSDIPFCVLGGCSVATGRGEILRPIRGLNRVPVVLVKPDFGIPTPYAYQHFTPEGNPSCDLGAMEAALKQGDVKAVADQLQNHLAKTAFADHPQIPSIIDSMKEEGALGAMMTGSGPTVFGLFETSEKAQNAANALRKKLPKAYCVLTTNTL